MSEAEKTTAAREMCNYAYRDDDNNEWFEFFLYGKPVCSQLICNVMGIGRRKFSACMDSRHSTVIVHGNIGRVHLNVRHEHAIAWTQDYVTNIGDYCPRSGKLYLPHCYTRADLYALYKEQNSLEGQSVLSSTWFGRLFKKNFPHVHTACRLMLGYCDECIKLSESRRKCSNQYEKDAWKFAHGQHLQLQQAECIAYQS